MSSTPATQEVLPPLDWAAIRAAYCAGVIPIPRICEIYTVSRSAMMRRAMLENWERNMQAALTSEVRRQIFEGVASSDLEPHIQAQAQAIVQVISDHRGAVSSLRELVQDASSELKGIIEAARENRLDEKMPMLAILVGKGSISSAVDTLASATDKIVALERKLLGLDQMLPIGDNRSGKDAPSGVSVTVYLPDNNRESN